MFVSLSVLTLVAVLTLAFFLSILNFSFYRIKCEDHTPLWLAAWLGASAVFALCRLLQYVLLSKQMYTVVPLILLTVSYTLVWLGYELGNSFVGYRPSRGEHLLIVGLVAGSIVLLWTSSMILTDQVVIRTILFGGEFHGVRVGPLYLPVNLLALALGAIPPIRLVYTSNAHRRENYLMAMGYIFVIISSLTDFIATSSNLTWIRFSDYSYLPLAIFFSYIQLQRFGQMYSEMDLRVYKRTMDLSQANETLRASEERYRNLIDHARDFIFTITIDGAFTSINPSFEFFTGWPRSEWLGRSFDELIAEEDRPLAHDLFKRVLRAETRRAIRLHMYTRPGRILVVELNMSPQVRAGQIVGLLGTARDITDKQLAEDALRGSEEKYRAVVENANDGIAIIQNGIVEYANPRLAEMQGEKIADILGQWIGRYVYLGETNETIERHREQDNDNAPITFETTLLCKGKPNISVELTSGLFSYRGAPAEIIIIRDISERKSTEQALQRQIRETIVLNTVATIGTESSDIDELIERVTGLIGTKLYQESCGVLLVDEETKTWKSHPSYRGIDFEDLAKIHSLSDGIVGKVIANARTVRVNDIHQEPDFLETTSGIKSELAVPVIVHGKIYGCLNVESKGLNAFSDIDECLLNTIAKSMSVAIEKILLLQIEKQRREEVEVLYNTTHDLVIEQDLSKLLHTIVEKAVGMLRASGGCLYLCEPERQQTRCVVSCNTLHDYSGIILQYGEGAAGIVAQKGEPLNIEDYRTWEGRAAVFEQDQPFISILSVPMYWQDRVIGVIHVHENTRLGAFTQDNLKILTLFANQAAIAVQNARLFEAEQRRRQEASAIAQVGRDISETLQLNTVLDRIASFAKKLLGADTSAVYLSEPETPRLRAIAAIGPEAEQIKNDDLQVGEGVLGNIALQKSGEIVNNAAVDSRAIQIKGTELTPFENLMGVPVLSKNRLTGLIAVWRTGAGKEFNSTEFDFLNSLAQQVAVAIENARLFEAEQKRRQEADTLRQAAEKITATLDREQALQLILEQLAKVVAYESASVQLLEDGYLEIVGGRGWRDPSVVLGLQFPVPGDNPNSTVVLERRPVVLGNALKAFSLFDSPPHNQIQSWLGVPLIVRDRVIGMFAVDHSQPDFFVDSDVQMVNAFASQAAIAIENARLFGETQKRLREMEALAQIGATLSSTLELEPLLENILRSAINAIPTAKRGSFLLVDEDKNLQIRAVFGYTDSRVHNFSFPADSGYSSLAYHECRAIMVPDVRADPRIRYDGDIPEMLMGGSAIAAPLIIKDHPIGVLAIDTPAYENAFNRNDLHLLGAIAASAAIAIENASLFENTRRRLSDIQVIHTISAALRSAQTLAEALPIILDQLMRLLNAGGASLEIVDLTSGEIVTELAHGVWTHVTGLRTPPGAGVSGYVMATGQPYVSTDVVANGKSVRPDLFADFHKVACVPIIAQHQPIGTLWIGRQNPIHPEEVNLLAAIGEIVGNAIHRMRLSEQTKRRANEFEVLYQTANHLASQQWDLPTLLETIVTQAMELLHTSGAGIYFYNPKDNDLQIVAAKGPAMKIGMHLMVDDEMAGRVFREQQPLIVDNYQTWESRSINDKAESVAAAIEVPITLAGIPIGVLMVYETRNSKRTYVEADARLLSLFATQSASTIRTARLLSELQSSNLGLAEAYDITLEGWARALELRDKETEGHSRRVTKLTLRLARRMGISEPELTHVHRGVLLHDIGKMGVPDQLLKKTAPLTDTEWVEMRKHPQYAYDLLHPIAYLRPALDIPYCHHEKWDGTGYPRGLKGKQIPLIARMFAVVDVYDALSFDRPYRAAWPRRKVLAYLREQSGKQFDPDVMDAFFGLLMDKKPHK